MNRSDALRDLAALLKVDEATLDKLLTTLVLTTENSLVNVDTALHYAYHEYNRDD